MAQIRVEGTWLETQSRREGEEEFTRCTLCEASTPAQKWLVLPRHALPLLSVPIIPRAFGGPLDSCGPPSPVYSHCEVGPALHMGRGTARRGWGFGAGPGGAGAAPDLGRSR